MRQPRRERQINAWLKKNRSVVEEAKNEKERDYILSMWAGFLSGLRMTNAITFREYQAYFDELKIFAEELGEKGA